MRRRILAAGTGALAIVTACLAVTLGAGGAGAATTCGGAVKSIRVASFDSLPEGAVRKDFWDNGVEVYGLNARFPGVPPPNIFVIDRATDDLGGRPGFTAPNVLGAGPHSTRL